MVLTKNLNSSTSLLQLTNAQFIWQALIVLNEQQFNIFLFDALITDKNDEFFTQLPV